MAKIVIDARELRTTSGRYVERLITYLQEVDTENHYTILLKSKDMDYEIANLSQFTKVACDHKEFSFDEQLGLKRQLEQLKPDLVHFAFAQQPTFYKGKKVTTMHDLTTLRFYNPDKKRTLFKIKQAIYAQVIKRAAKQSAAVITISDFVKQDLMNFTQQPAEKFSVTYESADPIPDSPTPLPNLTNDKFIMYVGRPTPHKNLERLVQAHALLLAQYPALKLVLVGKTDANYERIKASIPAQQANQVVFTGFASEGQLRWLYEHASAYVFPSLSEGFGLPALEAMLHGSPVVSSNATCLPEIYGEAAHYFDPLDVQSMADAINEVLTDKDLRTALIEEGHLQAKKYSWKRMAEQTLEIYNRV